MRLIDKAITVQDDGSRRGENLKRFVLSQLLRRLFRSYKSEYLSHRQHNDAYDISLQVTAFIPDLRLSPL